MGYQTLVKKPFLQGTTPRITFQIVDEDGAGFKPDTLTMSIYDVVSPVVGAFPLSPAGLRTPQPVLNVLSDSIVNSRNDVDVLAYCDVTGNVEIFLDPADTGVTVPGGVVPRFLYRRLLFTWTWAGSPSSKVGKHEVILTIAPDRETVAS